jgi:hypothetical protein
MAPNTRIAVVVALLIAVAYGQRAYGQTFAQESLGEVGPVRVIIEGLDEHATGIGLSEDGLQATVELQLRRNGVPLGPGVFVPWLYVHVMALSSDSPFVYTVTAEFNQISRSRRLLRSRNNRLSVTTQAANQADLR